LALPVHFCWSRFGTEAGQGIQDILQRKEQERTCNSGVFLWGIGNALGPSIRELVRRNSQPEVLFSPIKSAARESDKSPDAVAVWTCARDLSGNAFDLPETSLVTSRFDAAGTKATHYALVCFSDESLTLTQSDETIVFSELRNLLTGRPVGASQVTAVVSRTSYPPSENQTYGVAIRARLVFPYFLELKNPVKLGAPEPGKNWSNVVGDFRGNRGTRPATPA